MLGDYNYNYTYTDVPTSPDIMIEPLSFEHLISDHSKKLVCRRPSSRAHEEEQRQQNQFVCKLCCKSFKWKKGLQHHNLTAHSDSLSEKSLLVCQVCGQKFAWKCYFSLHMRKHENVECDVCRRMCTAATIKNHMLTHSTESRFECKKCYKRFRHPSSLNVHSKICGGREKPYTCDICDMKFTQQYSVTRHKNVVHNLNKLMPEVKCLIETVPTPPPSQSPSNISPGGYNNNNNSSSKPRPKARRGGGQKPYTCDLCGMKFTQSYSVTRHKNSAHYTQ